MNFFRCVLLLFPFMSLFSDISYDEIVGMIEDLEYGIAEEQYSSAELDKMCSLVVELARQGILPNQSREDLEQEIQELLRSENTPFYLAFDEGEEFSILPALYASEGTIVKCNWFSTQWRKLVNFVKKNKTVLIIGAVVLVTVGIIYGIYEAVSLAAVEGAAVSAAPSYENNAKMKIENRVEAFKHSLVDEPYFTESSYTMMSERESGRYAGSLLTHETLETIDIQLPAFNASFGHQKIDQQFGTDYAPLFAGSKQEPFYTLLYQLRGEKALKAGFFDLALSDFGQALLHHPHNTTPFLERATAFFELGDYANALRDFDHYGYCSPFSVLADPYFILGFYRGIRDGIYASSQGSFLFFASLIQHPTHCAIQVLDALSRLNALSRTEDLRSLLVPEVFSLVQQWDTLPSRTRGEMAGFAFGKHANPLLPLPLSKMASPELAAILQSFQAAEKALVLETLAAAPDPSAFTQSICAEQKTLALGNDLGFSYREMAQYKEEGILEKRIEESYARAMNNSYARRSFERQLKAKTFLKPHLAQFMPEKKAKDLIHQAGLRTFSNPPGIPKNFRTQIVKEGGILYVHPHHEYTTVCILPGMPHSPFPHLHEPYAKQIIDGVAIDSAGHPVDPSSPEAHIPLAHFRYRLCPL